MQHQNHSSFFTTDSYKLSHWNQYEKDTVLIFSNMTPRKSRVKGISRFCFIGLTYFLRDLHSLFEKNFFNLNLEEAVKQFKDDYQGFFSSEADVDLINKVEALHNLGYLPLEIRAIQEGKSVKHNNPVLVIYNTLPEFYWLTNWVETFMSCSLWQASTSATTAMHYLAFFSKYAEETSDSKFMVPYQGHDFSVRGMGGIEAAKMSGLGHLSCFMGTDNIPAAHFLQAHYNVFSSSFRATSVPATEHSVSMAGGKNKEFDTLKRMLTEVYPSGIFSFVSDTWDFWGLVTNMLPALKNEIMARDGKLVIRPDSSPKTPVEIIIGDPDAVPGSPEYKGLIQCLWDIFGGTINSKGYKELDSHIGAIYGDSITLEYQIKILEGLKKKGFASTNIVLGIGSYTYQYATRDTHGIAIKATACGKLSSENVLKVEAIFKDPKTDNSGKKSAKGVVNLVFKDGDYQLVESDSFELPFYGSIQIPFENSELTLRYRDGEFFNIPTWDQVRKNVEEELTKIDLESLKELYL